MHAIMMDFIIWGRLTRSWGPFGARGTALTRNVEDYMARRTCFREEYYTGMRGYNSAREDSRPKQKKTIYKNLMVFIDISGLISSFGLAAFVVQEYVVVLQ